VCFKAKQDKAIENKFDAMQAAGEKVILISSNYTPRNPTIEIGGDKQSVIGSSKYDEVKKSDKNAVKALVIDGYNGDGRGQIKYVKLAKEMEVSKSGKVGMSKSESARIKKKKEKRKAEKDAKLARIEKIFSKTPRDPIKYVRAISEVMLDDYGTFGYAKEQIVKLMGWTEEIKEAKESKELHRFAKRKLKDADLGEMLKFICCCYLADDIRSEWAGDKRIRVFELTALGPVGKKKKVVKMKAVKKGKRGRPRKSK
jgi:hypothetical protein